MLLASSDKSNFIFYHLPLSVPFHPVSVIIPSTSPPTPLPPPSSYLPVGAGALKWRMAHEGAMGKMIKKEKKNERTWKGSGRRLHAVKTPTPPPLYYLNNDLSGPNGPLQYGEAWLAGGSRNPKMALSKRCATGSDRRCNSLDVLLLSMVHHRTKQANGKSITAGARNKSNIHRQVQKLPIRENMLRIC